MREPLIMSPGPTTISEEVRKAMSRNIINPDLDPRFFEFYKETTEKLKRILKTKNDVLIINGEGILGLEAACASLIEPGDKVLCVDNGIFGKGFGDFAKIYGGAVTYFTCDYRKTVKAEELRKFLAKNSDFKVATLVHCETPSGLTNPIDELCSVLKEFGIISVVDSVSGIGGERIEVDNWNIDVVLGGSQKCLSAPPGLSFMSISPKAWNKILSRNQPIAGFYVNLALWKNWYREKAFPYTLPISDIYALDAALNVVIAEGDKQLEKHRIAAEAVRQSLVAAGLELYPLEGYSNTVTSVIVPKETSFKSIFDTMLNEHNILIAGAFDVLQDKVFRIGHMGENCSLDKLFETLRALNCTLSQLGVDLKVKIHEEFSKLV